MAFETGSATGRDDLLAKLKTFLEGDGWTVKKYAADGTGYRLHVSKSGVYVNLRSAGGEVLCSAGWSVTGIALQGSTGYDGDQDWRSQPGFPDGPYAGAYATMIDMTGAIDNYWFFSNGTQVDVVIEVATGVYESMHWGPLVKCGAYTGGMYFMASSSMSALTRYIPGHKYTTYAYAAEAGGWMGYKTNNSLLWPPFGFYAPGSEGFLDTLVTIAQTIGGVAPLLPLMLAINGGDYQPLGWPEHIRAIRMDYLDVGEEITLGSDTWVVLPVKGYEKGLSGFTGDLGLAIRKTV